jgi:transposase
VRRQPSGQPGADEVRPADRGPRYASLTCRPRNRQQLMVSKYADHELLYRQAQIYSRQGVDLDRSTLAGWVGRAAFELRPVHDALMADLKRSTKLFMDETRAPVLDPGARKTKTGYFWALARDERPWGGTAPPGVAFTYAPGRGGQHAERILQGFGGVLQVDVYAGYNRLIAPDRVGPDIQLAHCWAHARRKLIEITRTGPAPIAEEGVALIRDLYAIEAQIRGSDPAPPPDWPSGRLAPPRSLPASTPGCTTTAPGPPPNHRLARPSPISPDTATDLAAS